MDCRVNGRQREILEPRMLTEDRGLKVPIITLYGLGESFSPSFGEEVVEIITAKARQHPSMEDKSQLSLVI